MSNGAGNDEVRPLFSHYPKAHAPELSASLSGRSHHSPSSSPSLGGQRTNDPPPLDLRSIDSPSSAFGKYVSNVTGHSSLPQFYVAVERPHFKLGTLKDLLEVLVRRGEVAVGVCCGTRDVLDNLVGAISYETRFSVQCLHSDMSEIDRSKVLFAFHSIRRSSIETGDTPPKSSPAAAVESPSETDPSQADVKQESSMHALNLLVMTDACLPMAALGENPLMAKLMINYELPAKKEQYARRVAAVLGPAAASALPKLSPAGSSPPRSFPSGAANSSSGIVLSFVAAAEVGMLRSLEESLGYVIEEMPINILELL